MFMKSIFFLIIKYYIDKKNKNIYIYIYITLFLDFSSINSFNSSGGSCDIPYCFANFDYMII